MNSVCIATYNGEKYIAQQLQSILGQIAEEDEVIISDDCSTDNTLKIIDEFKDKRIHIVHNNTHYFRDNFANALIQAKGDIVFLSDQDDVWLSGKYKRCIDELLQVDLVCTNSCIGDENLNIIHNNFFSVYHSGKGILKNSLNNTYYGACLAFRRSLLDKALPFPPTHEIGHDIWLGLVAEMTGNVKFIDTPYIIYRRHKDTVTSTNSIWTRSSRPLYKKLWNRVVVLFYVIAFYIRNGKQFS